MTRIVGDIVNGSSSLAFISSLTSLSTLFVTPLTVNLTVFYMLTNWLVTEIKYLSYRILRNCKLSGNLGAVNISKLANLILL
jgi:hypothetical protein